MAPENAEGVSEMPAKFDKIIDAVLSGNASAVKEQVKKALAMGEDPEKIISDGLVKAMDIVGMKFEHNEIYVTELIVTSGYACRIERNQTLYGYR